MKGRKKFLVEHDLVDLDIYRELAQNLPAVKMLERDTALFPDIKQFLFECFCLFFKEEPYLSDQDSIPTDAKFRGELLHGILETPVFFEQTARTTLDEFASTVITIRITRAILRVLEEARHNAMAGAALVAALRHAIAGALQGASNDLDTLNQWARGWGTEPGQLERLPVQEKFRLMEQLLQTRALRELSKITGNAVAIMAQKRASRVRTDASEIVGAKSGGELEHILPSELSLLSRPRLRRLLRVRLVERTYLTHEFRPRTEQGRGPLIVCIDTSGSMQDGWRENWAKAVSIALYTQARHERRTFAYIHFSSRTELRKVVVRKHEPGIDQLVDIATFAYGGGTDFNRPLTEAMALIREEAALRRADIVFISDGECAVSGTTEKKLTEAKAELGFSVWGVLVQQGTKERGAFDQAHAKLLEQLRRFYNPQLLQDGLPSHIKSFIEEGLELGRKSMEVFCDRVIPVTEFTAKSMSPIFDSILDGTG